MTTLILFSGAPNLLVAPLTSISFARPVDMTKDQDLREAILESQAVAALGGHDVGPFETAEDGYRATCRLCGESSWVGPKGQRKSTLDDVCPGRSAPTPPTPSDEQAKPLDMLKDIPRGAQIAFALGILFSCWLLRFVSFRLGLLVLATVLVVGLAGFWWQRSRVR
jgi:hypothetical protein